MIESDSELDTRMSRMSKKRKKPLNDVDDAEKKRITQKIPGKAYVLVNRTAGFLLVYCVAASHLLRTDVLMLRNRKEEKQRKSINS